MTPNYFYKFDNNWNPPSRDRVKEVLRALNVSYNNVDALPLIWK